MLASPSPPYRPGIPYPGIYQFDIVPDHVRRCTYKDILMYLSLRRSAFLSYWETNTSIYKYIFISATMRIP